MKGTGSNRFSSSAFVGVIAAVFISGAAGLAYEVVWSRMFVVPLGNSSDATALVLAAFMLGIALGARLLGGLADRVRSPLKLYAVVEIGLGLYALIMPLLIGAISSTDIFRGSFEDQPLAAIGRLASAGLLVAFPSMAMGATLPVLVRALSSKRLDVRQRIGIVYGANTIGAAVGASIAGFIAIPLFGLTLTSAGSACLSFAAAFIVLAVRSLAGDPVSDSVDNVVDGSSDEAAVPSRSIALAALIAATASGFVMLAAEVLWARILTFVFGHDTYAFAVLLAIVLLGLGVGGLVYRKLADRDPALVVSLLLGLTAMALLDSFWVASSLIIKLGRDPFGLGTLGDLANSLRLEFFREILFTPVLVFIPAVLAGATFPAACAFYAGPVAKTGRRVGTATLVNGFGSAAGALFTSFILVSWLGIEGSFLALALLLAATSVVVMIISGRLSTRHRLAILVTPVALTVLVAAIMPASQPRAMLGEAVGKKHQRILYYEEGRTGTVSVTENTINGEKQLFMNAVNEVTTRLVHDQSFKLLGHLGPLLHPQPKNGLMICLGAGLSAGAALVHPLARLDVVELSAAIPRAAALWGEENNGALKDPRFHLHVADGRHFLNESLESYDVVMVDSTHPKAVDSWILYTKEFYELVHTRLSRDGIAVQWVPLHGLSEREFKIIVRTFQSVFPETTLWVNVGFEIYGQAAYVKMVGTTEPLLIDYRELALRLKEPRIEQDLKPFGMAAPEELLNSFLAGPKVVQMWTEGLPIQTDNHPIVPFTTSFSTGRRMTAPLLLGVRSFVQPFLRRMSKDEPVILKTLKKAHEAQGFLLAGLLDRAFETWPDSETIRLYKERSARGRDYYAKLGELYDDNADKMFEIGSYLGNLGYTAEARRLYENAINLDPSDSRFRLNLALVLLDQGDNARATEMLSTIVKQEPWNALAHYNLGVALNTSKNPINAVSHLEKALEIAPDLINARLSLADALLGMNELEAAESELSEVIARNRWIAEAWDMLGLVAVRQRDWDQARKYHIRALGLEPYRAQSHYNLGIALQESGRLKEAAAAYQAALRIEPQDAEAHNNLGLVFAAVGLYDRAVKSHIKALEIEPTYAESAYNLGLAYREQGRHLLAGEAFGLALKIAPNLTPAQEQLRQMGVEQAEISVELKETAPRDAGP
ncbi:MAG: tetratricopeptide repeat protein [Proteobacteria bacterium]|nr:tetratricopeptide repeat protein [Pseudomonadota bacterium]